MARSINRETFKEAAAALRREDLKARVVDVLVPLREELNALRKEGRTYLEIWRVLGAAGLTCSYPNAIRAIKQVLNGPVQPLAEARARSRERRAAKRLPVVPVALVTPAALRETPVPVSSMTSFSGDPYRQAATQQVANELVKAFGKPKT